MSAESQRFARLVLARFKDVDLATDEEVKRAQGPSSTTLTKFRKAEADETYDLGRLRGDVFTRVDQAAQWRPGSARRLYERGETPQVEVDAVLVERIRAAPGFSDREKRIMIEALSRPLVERSSETPEGVTDRPDGVVRTG